MVRSDKTLKDIIVVIIIIIVVNNITVINIDVKDYVSSSVFTISFYECVQLTVTDLWNRLFLMFTNKMHHYLPVMDYFLQDFREPLYL